MTFFIEIATILNQPPSSLVYHLMVLFALELTLIIGWSYWRRTAEPGSERLALAAGLALGLRATFALAAILAGLSIISGQILPPLDRAIALATLLLLGWALLSQPPHRTLDGLLALGGLGLLVATVLAIIFWLQIDTTSTYNNTLDDQAWQAAYILTALAMMFAFITRRPDDWGLGLGIYGLWFGAASLHLILAYTETPIPGNYDGLRRVAEIAIFGSYTGLAYRHTLRNATPIVQVTPPAPAPTPPPPRVVEKPRSALASKAAGALVDIGIQPDWNTTARAITQAVCRTLLADIALLWEAPEANRLICAGGYDLIRETDLEGFVITTQRLPTLDTAFKRGRPVHLRVDHHPNELHRIADRLYIAQVGPAFMMPLFHDGEIQGGVMVLSPHAQRTWTVEEQKTLAAMARPIAAALHHIQERQQLEDLEARAKAAEDSLRAASAQSSSQQQQIESLTAQLAQRQASGNQVTAEELAQLKGEIDAMRRERDQLQTHVDSTSDQQAALDALHAQVEALHAARSELAASNQQLAEKNSQTALDFEQAQDVWQQERETLYNSLASVTTQLEALQMEELHGENREGEQVVDHDTMIDVAHELRQPMTSVLNYADMLLGEDALPEELPHKLLKRIKANVARMSILLDELLKTTNQPDSEQVASERIDLLDLLDNAISASSQQFREKGILLQMDIPDRLPAIQANSQALYQVISQLLANAFTVTHKQGEVAVRAQISEADDHSKEQFIHLTVRDSGGGIAPEDQPRVFNRMARSTHPQIAGLGDNGAGLTEAKTLVEAMNGRIWLESAPEQGTTTFNVILPVRPGGGAPTRR